MFFLWIIVIQYVIAQVVHVVYFVVKEIENPLSQVFSILHSWRGALIYPNLTSHIVFQCQALNEEEIHAIQDRQSLFPVGWIHVSTSFIFFTVQIHSTNVFNVQPILTYLHYIFVNWGLLTVLSCLLDITLISSDKLFVTYSDFHQLWTNNIDQGRT